MSAMWREAEDYAYWMGEGPRMAPCITDENGVDYDDYDDYAWVDEAEGTTGLEHYEPALMPRGRGRMERIQRLALAKEIRCDRCKPHRGDNAVKRPQSDRGKNHRRAGR